MAAREKAIHWIKAECADNGKIGVVVGHLMSWDDETQPEGKILCTTADLNGYTYIIYFDVDPPTIHKRRSLDTKRLILPVDHLKKWQINERQRLHHLCQDNKILFSIVETAATGVTATVIKLLRDFCDQDVENDQATALSTLDELVRTDAYASTETVLVQTKPWLQWILLQCTGNSSQASPKML